MTDRLPPRPSSARVRIRQQCRARTVLSDLDLRTPAGCVLPY